MEWWKPAEDFRVGDVIRSAKYSDETYVVLETNIERSVNTFYRIKSKLTSSQYLLGYDCAYRYKIVEEVIL